jgi:hypothetical protein
MYSYAMLKLNAVSYLQEFVKTATDPQQADIMLQNLGNDLTEAGTDPESFSIGFLYPEDPDTHSMRILRRQQFFETCFRQIADYNNPVLRAMFLDAVARYTGNPAVPYHSDMQNIHRAAARLLLKETAENNDPRYAGTLDGLHESALDILVSPETDILSRIEHAHKSETLMIIAQDITDCILSPTAILYSDIAAQDFTPCRN